MPQGAFEGVRVVEVAQWVAAPSAGALLADWGADVIHVEHPVKGDAMRGLTSAGGMEVDWLFELDNRSKRSFSLDVSRPEGQSVLYRLLEKSDVLLTSLRPSELERYRIDYPSVSRVNPRLVFASLTGYGRKGPEREKRGYDITAFWARSGFMATLREPDGPPVFPRGGMGDHISAIALAGGIAAALFARERTGTGQEVDVSLYNTGVWALSVDISCALATGQYPPLRKRSETPAMTNVYETKDNRWIYFAHLQQDPYWPAFCRALGLEGIENDERFNSIGPRMANNTELFNMVEAAMKKRALAEWLPVLDEHGLIYSTVQEATDIVRDEQAWANDFFTIAEHPTLGKVKLVANPIKLSKMPSSVKATAPQFSQHTEEILLENGYSWDEIAGLKEQGIIA
ncbi:MAG: CoA transferase [Dehalococcoidia bacterium]|nr:CoA transferase [Dehalococcoidia bacterium]